MEKKEIVFVDGASLRKLSDKAPSFIKAKIDINAKKFTQWLRENAKPNDKGDWWATIDIRVSKNGVLYLCLDDFVKSSSQEEQPKQPKQDSYFNTSSTSSVKTSVEYQGANTSVEKQEEIDISQIPF